MSNAQNIITVATDLQQSMTKKEIAVLARSYGWRGDEARAPMLQLALYVATKIASGEQPQEFAKEAVKRSGEGEGAQHQGQQHQGQQQQQQHQQQDGDQSGNGKAPEGQQQSQQAQSQQQQQQQQQDGEQSGNGKAPEGQQQQDGDQGQQQQQQQQQQQDGDQGQQQQQQQQQQDGDQGQQQQQQQAEGNDAEWTALLKASGITTPHRLLRKVWLLTAKAKQNVLLIGAAGTGKTHLSAQLAQLLRVPFGSISCTMGMSESQLTGWLLPVGKKGRFEYVESPFVRCIKSESVFLLDEVDAADPNVLMLLNSVTSNGFITIPHKLEGATVQRHANSIIIAGANTTGSGADDIYSARAALDGATIDRFYPVIVKYDADYERSIFGVSGRKAPTWKPAPARTAEQLASEQFANHAWFADLRKNVEIAKLQKIVSSRLAQRLAAATAAGIPAVEARKDLLIGWSKDELNRAKVGGV